MDVGRNRELQAHIFPLHGCERVVGAVRLGGERTGAERHFVADDDFRFLVVEGHEAGRR